MTIIPINVREELARAYQAESGNRLQAKMGGMMIEELEIVTQAIFRKVTLNPTLFQIFDTVRNLKDSEHQEFLFNGDFGDFISESVMYIPDVTH